MYSDGHHDFSPSKLTRIRECPGSYRLTKTHGLTEPEQDYTEEGRNLHKCIELMQVPADPAEAELVDKCVQVYQTILASIGPQSKLTHERKLTLWADGNTVLTEGTADVVIEDEELQLVTIIDWKFGRNPVAPAKDNLQTAVYAAAAAEAAGWTRARAIIYQPRIMSKPDQHVFEFFQLGMVKSMVKAIVDRAMNDPEMTLKMGAHCTYCPARGLCPLQDYTQSLVPSTCKDLEPSHLERAYEMWKILQYRGESIEYNFKRAVEAGKVPGWEIGKRSGGREFTNVNDAASKLFGTFTIEELFAFVDMSVKGIEEAFARKLKEAGTVKTLKKGEEAFATLMGDLIKKKPEQSVLKKVGK